MSRDYYRRKRELTARGLQAKFRKKYAIARDIFKELAKNPQAPSTWLLDCYFMTNDLNTRAAGGGPWAYILEHAYGGG